MNQNANEIGTEKVSNSKAIVLCFKQPGVSSDCEYKPLSIQEVKALTPEERKELGLLAAQALGLRLIEE